MKTIRILIAAALLVLLLVLFSEAPRTVANLHVSWFKVLATGDLDVLLRQVRTPLAGEQVLPTAVQAGIALLRSSGATAYRYSQAFRRNEELRQRLIEGAYPIRAAEHTAYLLLLEQETPDGNCSPVSRGGGVVLVHCP